MKLTLLFLALIFTSLADSQVFEVEQATHPYFDIIEWKGMGALLLSKDPSGNSKQINLTLVNEEKKSVWDQKFSPKGKDYYFITSENARYVYFLNNLELEGGKVSLSQLNSAGNIKSTSISIGAAIKKLKKYDYNKLELINVVVTDKALVHHFRYDDKSTKSIVDLAVFTTHHNFLSYAVELGSVTKEAINGTNYGHWQYVGFTGDQIFFAAREFMHKKQGWSVKEYSSKGKVKIGMHIDAPQGLIAIENIGFGTTGSYYLEDKATVELGLLTYINSNFYLIGGQHGEGTSAEITLFQLVENEWNVLNSMKLNYFIEKKNLKLGIYPMNQGVGYHLDHNGYNKVSIIYYEKKEGAPHNDFTKRTVYNPSSVFERKNKQEFNVILPNGILIFDTGQLGKKGSVKFEIIEK